MSTNTQNKNNKKFNKGIQIIKNIYSKRLSADISYRVRNRAKIQEEISVFDGYLNSYSISDIKLKYLNGLNYIKYQYTRLNDFLSEKKGIKIFLEVDLIVSKEVHTALNDLMKLNDATLLEETDDGIEYFSIKIRSRNYEISNNSDLKDVLKNMGRDITIIVENKQLKRSGLTIENR